MPVDLADAVPLVWSPTGPSLINLCTNPDFEGGVSPIEVWRNLATNPSFEASGGTTEVRRNQVPNPKAISSGTGWGANAAGGASTQTYLTGSGLTAPLPTEYTRMAWTSAALGAGGGRTMPTTVALSVGTHQVSMYARTSLAQNLRISSQGGTWLGSFTSQPVVTTVANTWVLVTGILNVTTSGTFIGYIEAASGGHNWAIGETLDTTGGLIVSTVGTFITPYFDGTISQDSDLTPSWTGAANASSSILSGAGATSTAHGSCSGVSSTQWASTGVRSLRQIPNVSGNGSNSRVAGASGALVGMSVTFVAGHTYTIMAKLRLTAAQTGTLHSEARRITVTYNGTGGTTVRTAQPTNVAGVYSQSLTFTLPTDATFCDVLLWNGASMGNGDTWWDDLLIVTGPYAGPYFDGANQAKVRRNLVPNPSVETNITGWAGASTPPAVVSRTTTQAYVGTASVMAVCSGAATGQGAYISGIPASPGEIHTLSVYVKGDAGRSMFVEGRTLTAGGAALVSTPGSTVVLTGGWDRLSVTMPAAPATTTQFMLIVRNAAAVAHTFYVDAALAETGATLGTYFDGATPASGYSAGWDGTTNNSASYLYDADLVNSWTGTANASASVLTGQRPFTTSVNQDSSPPGVAYTKSYRHTEADGTYSTRWLRTTGDTGAGWRILQFSQGIFNGLPMGTVVTVKLRVYSATAISLMVGILNGSGLGPGANQSQAVPAGVWTTLTYTYTFSMAGDANHLIYITTPGVGTTVDFDKQFAVAETYTGDYFDGDSPSDPGPGYFFAWTGASHASTSTKTVLESSPGDPADYLFAVPPGPLPGDSFISNRVTEMVFERLSSDDAPEGPLDGVTTGTLTFDVSGMIKGGGTIEVTDTSQLTGEDAIDWVHTRIRIVRRVNDMEWGRGIWVPTFPAAKWKDGTRAWTIELHDKLVVLDQDKITSTLVYPAGTVVTTAVRDVIESAGENAGSITPDPTKTLTNDMMWEPGTSKLAIVNNMLDASGYFTLRMDSNGAYVAAPYITPHQRALRYEFVDGETAIYLGEFEESQDIFFVPNRVLAIQQGDDTTEGMVGLAENVSLDSPYSFPNVGRWITDVQTGVEATDQEALDSYAYRRLVDLSNPSSTIGIQFAPVPLDIYDAVRFRSTPAGIDDRFVVDRIGDTLTETGLMTATLRKVVDYT